MSVPHHQVSGTICGFHFSFLFTHKTSSRDFWGPQRTCAQESQLLQCCSKLASSSLLLGACFSCWFLFLVAVFLMFKLRDFLTNLQPRPCTNGTEQSCFSSGQLLLVWRQLLSHKDWELWKWQSTAHHTSVPRCLSASQCAYSGPKLSVLLI